MVVDGIDDEGMPFFSLSPSLCVNRNLPFDDEHEACPFFRCDIFWWSIYRKRMCDTCQQLPKNSMYMLTVFIYLAIQWHPYKSKLYYLTTRYLGVSGVQIWACWLHAHSIQLFHLLSVLAGCCEHEKSSTWVSCFMTVNALGVNSRDKT